MQADADSGSLPRTYLDVVRILREEEEHELEEALRAQTESIRLSLRALVERRIEAEAALNRVHVAIATREAQLEKAAKDYYQRKQEISSGSLFAAANTDSDMHTGVQVYSTTGVFMGDVMPIETENPVVEILLDLPVLRSVTVRRDWNHDPGRLNSIYQERNITGSGKPFRWVAVMIQATGEVLNGGDCCGNCARGMGPFEECIMLPGDPFRKCGNCEWSKRPCSPSSHQPPPSSSAKAGLAVERFRGPSADDSVAEHDYSGGDFSIDDRAEGSPVDLEPIGAANLSLRHNGKVYTHPACMEGVPVEKIGPGHPYWDPEWDPDLMSTIRVQTLEWKAKLEASLHNTSSVRFAKQRQVNRGEAMLEFLNKGPIHPFQLVAKKYMDARRLASFDTLFRLAETLRTLSNNGLDITPEEWVRHRLHEIITETQRDGQTFDLAKAIANFYHDPKVVAFRDAKGIKTIGRPAGYKMAVPPRRKKQKTDFDTSATGSPAPGAYNNNNNNAGGGGGYHTASFVRADDGSPDAWAQGSQAILPAAAAATAAAGGELVRRRKRQTDAELGYEGFTDTDEKMGDRMTKHDFALRSVKSRAYATNSTVTQYWHWVEQGEEAGSSSDRLFQHQVFLPCEPPQWGLYSAPVDFHFGLQDVKEIVWASDTLKAVVRCGGAAAELHGDMIGDFARERTKRRFLVFCMKKGLRVVKSTAFEIEMAWEMMNSQVLGPLGQVEA
ncbi:hypothetical protein SODALDRAFT_351234 [Sodiomyces alkalinus F11]|uniref:Uncharacterized protein n=1 Tax=Sodiomyces alkalinus (strain CBS 110278 / VKM F-3762 / F11) TaxID=1314773 RepID=A0A3N2PUF0_SODAK|nr:hypothetical protein SODALDRAFT_351234 [Sodiomyces alkalinus F11]ROT38084.1 hypothetical protein SODALDRAFT_351234 [Sodiomyces alkalinus F11]